MWSREECGSKIPKDDKGYVNFVRPFGALTPKTRKRLMEQDKLPDTLGSSMEDYRFRSVRPIIPSIAKWSPYLEEAYSKRWFSNFGSLSLLFENKLREKFGADEGRCVLTSSATTGLAACLISRGIEGAVLFPAFTFPASMSAIRMAGGTPVVIDVERDTWIPSVVAVENALRSTGAKATMLVSPFGLKCDFQPVIEVCRYYDSFVIIDSAAGLGISREQVEKARDVMEIYSMHATKPFSVGEGGVIFAHQCHVQSLRSSINFGIYRGLKPEEPIWGINGKLSEFHAAVGLAQLAEFDSGLERRKHLVARYISELEKISEIVFPKDVLLSPWQYLPVVLPCRNHVERFVKIAAQKGMEVRRYYRPSLSTWPHIESVGACPNAEWLSERICCLPVYGDASEQEEEEMLMICLSSLEAALSGID